MRVMVIVKATEDSEQARMPSMELLTAMGKFNEELIQAGLMLSGDGVKPTAAGYRIAFDGDGRAVRPGPFGPASEQLAGFWIWQVKDVEEALAWVRRCPNPMPGPSELEIRPLYKEADFM